METALSIILGIVFWGIIIKVIISRRKGFDMAKNISNLEFAGDTATFNKEEFTYGRQTVRYEDVISVKNHYDVGWTQLFIFRTDTTILQVVFELNNGMSVTLERSGRSFWGIGTNGAVATQRNIMSGLLADKLSPHLSNLLLEEIEQHAFIELGSCRVDKSGITKSKIIGADAKLDGSNFGEAKFNYRGDVAIYDKLGNKFVELDHTEPNMCAVPMLLDKLYKHSQIGK